MFKMIIDNWQHFVKILWLPVTIQLIALLVGLTINRFINRKMAKHVDLEESRVSNVILLALRGISVAFCSGIGLYWTIRSLNLTPTLTNLLTNILVGVIFMTIAKVMAEIAGGLIELKTEQSTKLEGNSSLFMTIIKTVIYALVGLALLQYYGISITPLITAMGLGGMAVAFGLREIMANIFSGLHLVLSGQVRVGDYIRLSTGEEGKVIDVTLRYTTVQTVINNTIVIPNKNISDVNLTNFNKPAQEVSIIVPLGVSYDSDLDKVERVTLEVANHILDNFEGGHEEKDPSVKFHTFGEYSIQFNVVLHCRRYPDQLVIKHEFIKALTKRYREEGINIPCPIMTIEKKY